MPMARRIAPHAALLGVRGRATEEGTNRWFRRVDAMTLDQRDIRSEAEAFAAFVEGAVTGYGLDRDRLVFLGYSNGANMLAAVIQLHPGVVRRAVLLRGIQPLEKTPALDMSESRVLVITGRDDALGRNAPALTDALMAHGAHASSLEISANHDLSAADVIAATEWIERALSITR